MVDIQPLGKKQQKQQKVKDAPIFREQGQTIIDTIVSAKGIA